MGSQWSFSSRDNDEMFDFLLTLRQILAALFWTFCNFLILRFEMPKSKLLQKSSLEDTNACIKDSVVFRSRRWRMDCIFERWKWDVLQKWSIWVSIVIHWSRNDPRFLQADWGRIGTSPTVNDTGGSNFWIRGLEKIVSSVLHHSVWVCYHTSTLGHFKCSFLKFQQS